MPIPWYGDYVYKDQAEENVYFFILFPTEHIQCFIYSYAESAVKPNQQTAWE